jgi:hypothetical protein
MAEAVTLHAVVRLRETYVRKDTENLRGRYP